MMIFPYLYIIDSKLILLFMDNLSLKSNIITWWCQNFKRSCYLSDRPANKFWISLFAGRKII